MNKTRTTISLCQEAPCFSGRAAFQPTLIGICKVGAFTRALARPALHPRRLSQSQHTCCMASLANDDAVDPSVEAEEETTLALAYVDTEWVEIGIVGPSHGVRGEFKVQPLTDFPEDRLGSPGPRWLQAPAPKLGGRGAPPPVEVELEGGRSSVSKGHNVWLVKLEGIDSPEEATLIRGHRLLIPATMRDPLEDEDEFYVQELVGMEVVLQSSGELLGKVVDLFDGTGTHDVLRLELAPKEGDTERKQLLIPFVKEMVPIVDVSTRRMEITPPPGLLDLAAPVQQTKIKREDWGKKIREKRPKKETPPPASDQLNDWSPNEA